MELIIITGISRVDDLIEEQKKSPIDNNTIRMLGRNVIIIPKFGPEICGLFIGEKRLYEYSKGTVFVIQTSPGINVFISRDEVSYVKVAEIGYSDEGVSEDTRIQMMEKMFETS